MYKKKQKLIKIKDPVVLSFKSMAAYSSFLSNECSTRGICLISLSKNDEEIVIPDIKKRSIVEETRLDDGDSVLIYKIDGTPAMYELANNKITKFINIEFYDIPETKF